MAEDPRDKRTPRPPHRDFGAGRRRTPGGGVIPSTTSAASGESWEGPDSYTPVHPTPPPDSAAPELPSISDSVQALDRRSRETKNVAITTKNVAITTIDRIEDLRRETRQDIRDVSQRLANTDEKVNTVIEVVGELRERVAEHGGQSEVIIDMLKEQKQAREHEVHVKTTARVAEIEVDRSRALTGMEIEKARELAAVEETKADKALRRELVKALTIKAVAAIGVVWAFVSAIYMSKCGG